MRPPVTGQLSAPSALLPWWVNLTPASAACDSITVAVATAAMVEAVLVDLGDPITCGLLPHVLMDTTGIPEGPSERPPRTSLSPAERGRPGHAGRCGSCRGGAASDPRP